MKLILFFNGWGMDDGAVKYIEVPEDYELKILNFPYCTQNIEFEKYEERYLAAWSFGAYYACKFVKENPGVTFKKKTAVNGVPETIGAFGIPERIFKGTLENLTPETLKEFYSNMGAEDVRSERSFEEIKAELQYFGDHYEPQENIYDTAVIGKNDRIIPSSRQKKYYTGKDVETIEIDAPHYPFDSYKNWKEIIG